MIFAERVKVKRLRTNMCNLKKEPTDSSRKLLKHFHSRYTVGLKLHDFILLSMAVHKDS